MRLILRKNREDSGQYRDLDLKQGLPNLNGLRLEEVQITAQDIYWLGQQEKGAAWLIAVLSKAFTVWGPEE